MRGTQVSRRRPGQSAPRYPRSARVNELIVEVVGEELERLSDPRLELVTVTGADVNNDLSRATVFYSSLGAHGEEPSDEAVAATAAALTSAAPHLRAVLGRQVRWRSTPQLVFQPDPAILAGRRIEALLREIHERGDGPSPWDDEDEDLR